MPLLPIAAILFSIFPLTDTDIWWHLACAREWVVTWTPVRAPVVNVHEFFQLVVGFVYGLGGAPLLVAFKAVLWGIVFWLFVVSQKRGLAFLLVAVLFLFIFRYHLEIRPVLFSLLFLGIYWNAIPWLAEKRHESRFDVRQAACAVLLLAIQWLWCKCQGLYILGPVFATLVLCSDFFETKKRCGLSAKSVVPQVAFVLFLWLMPFLHHEGLALFLYPFGLLDRLLGLSPSAAVFASQIAENRSPVTLLIVGENTLESVFIVVLCVAGMVFAVWRLYKARRPDISNVTLLVTAILALFAERNFVLFLPVFLPAVSLYGHLNFKFYRLTSIVVLAFLLGLWARSLSAYDYSMVAYQRVPVDAANWMKVHPHQGRLFNDDRAGGYLAFVNPADSIYMDGRFILKTADFFERYLEYAEKPELFITDAQIMNIDRAVLPLRYYARWRILLLALEKEKKWHRSYQDDYFVIFDRDFTP